MIKKELIDLATIRTKTSQRELVEKDFILHKLLVELAKRKEFSGKYAFKGGTCLMKCYTQYYRFSEDLDFTFIGRQEFKNIKGKQRKKLLSKKISETTKMLWDVCKTTGLEFTSDKSNKRYIEIGGSGAQATFKLWYLPEGMEEKQFIKIQVNFLEALEFPLRKRKAKNFFFGEFEDLSYKPKKTSKASFKPEEHPSRRASAQLELLLPEESEWLSNIPVVTCYDIREILIEKVRAALTRKGNKARDYIDIYMIEKNYKEKPWDYKLQILKKTINTLSFEKYKENFHKKNFKEMQFDKKREERILLNPIPEDFNEHFEKLKKFLEELSRNLVKELNSKKAPKLKKIA